MDGIVDSIEDVADLVVGLIPILLIPMEICHSVLTAKAVKKYWSRSASFQFPLLCLITTLGATFGGSIMVNFLTFRKPILSGLLAPRPVAITVAAWWLVFYCPMNIFEKFCSNRFVLLPMVVLKELFRTKKVWMAAEVGFAVYEGHLLLATLIGSLGAVGGGLLMNLVVLLTSEKKHDLLADFRLSVLTKLGLFFSALYVLEIAEFAFVPERNVIAFIQFIVVAPIIYASKCGMTIDPFVRLENIFTLIVINLGRVTENKEKKE